LKRFYATYRQLVVVTAVNAIDIIAVVDAINIDGVTTGHHAVVGPVIVVVVAVEAGGQMGHSHL
jgi:hypothetical protein